LRLFFVELTAGVAEDGESVAAEAEVAGMVVLEGDVAVVVLVAVGFDREVDGGPDEVDRDFPDAEVDHGRWDAMALAEGEEVALEVAAGAVGVDSGVELDAAVLSFADGATVEPWFDRALEVEERAADRGDRDVGAAGEVGRGQRAGPVDSDALALGPAGAVLEGDMGRAVLDRPQEAPERAALAWLRTAPSPQASTAAIHHPSWLRPAWPTA
jgi:hypothetical protein